MIDELILLYAPPWAGATRFSKHHLAAYFAQRGTRVLYVEAPLTPLAVRRRTFAAELRETLRPPRRVGDQLWVRRHFLPLPYHAITPLTSARTANRFGQRWLAPIIRHDLRSLGFRRPLIVAGLPHAADAVGLLPKRGLVYHCADDYAHVSGFPRSLPGVEADLCRMADLVVTTSETLCQARVPLNPRTYWIPNGADVEHFSKPATPSPELQHIPHPVVGFVGGLSEWVDLELVATTARRHADWSVVLVGPVAIDTSPVDRLANVHVIGPRPYTQVPSWLAGMDVALIPFKHNEVTYHADPIKAYEYLAAGLPVVATDLPALRRLSQVLRLTDSTESFIANIEAAIAEGREADRAARQAEAARHGWAARFQEFERLVDETLNCES